MLAYIIRRLLSLIPVLLGVTIIVFALMHISGDPISLLYGINVPQEFIDAKRHELGLDRSVIQQYLDWIWGVLRGQWGRSLRTSELVLDTISTRVAATLQLTISGFLISILASVPAGVISATKRNSVIDHITRIFALFWVSMPGFWLGLIFILFFGVQLRLFPLSGTGGGSMWSASRLQHLILPSLTLGLPFIAMLTRFLRSNMLEILNEDYIRTARSKGLSEALVIMKHGLRNGLIPFVTILGLRLPWLFGGAVITETVFAWPGMGRALVTAVLKRDYFVVQGIVLFMAILVVVGNLLVDLSYAAIDPRIRYE